MKLGQLIQKQHPMVRQQDRRNARGDGGPDVGHRLVGPPRSVAGQRHPGRQAEHGQGFDPTSDRTVGHGVGGRVRRMRVKDAADVEVVRVHRRVHGDHGTLDGRQITLQEGSV